MKNDIVVYPISANPPTLGHADIMQRAARRFKKLYWVAAINPNKIVDFPVDLQINMMNEYVKFYEIDNVIVDHVIGSMIRYAMKVNAEFIIRGIRNTSDLQLEMELATAYRGINDKIETICFLADPKLVTVSSNLVRQISKVNENITPYVLPKVAKMIDSHYKKTNKKITLSDDFDMY